MEQTPFDRLGGEGALRAILKDFYDRLFDDLLVGFFFQGKDKAQLIDHQYHFTARALGGPVTYSGKTIAAAHKPLPILAGHFDRRHLVLRQTLEDHRVAEDIREVWLKLDLSFREVVVKAPGAPGTGQIRKGPRPSP